MKHWLLILFFLPALSSAQVNFSLYTSSMYDDNSFSIYDKRADVYHSIFGALSTDKQISSYVYLQGYYYGAVVLFRTYEQRTYNIHTLGAYTQIQLNYRDDDDTGDEDEAESAGEITSPPEGSKPAAPDSQPAAPVSQPPEEIPVFTDSLVSYLFVIPQIGARFDHEIWDFYDFQRASLLLKWRRPITGKVGSDLFYNVQFKRYPHLQQFTHVENIFGLSMNYDFSRRMELFAAADYGFKSYTETLSDTLLPGDVGEDEAEDLIKQFSTPSTSQVVLSAGLVYRLFPRHPLSLSYLRRVNPSNTARYIGDVLVIGSTEDEIFDDRYGYEGHELLLHLDGMLPGNIRVISSLQYVLKQYPREATDLNGVTLEGDPLREDNRFVLMLQFLYPLLRSPDGRGLSAGLVYNFIRNESNNAYNNYNVNQIAFVLSGNW